jgi:hypothetical protein
MESDPDPYKNVADAQHWLFLFYFFASLNLILISLDRTYGASWRQVGSTHSVHHRTEKLYQVERFHLTPDMFKPAYHLSPHDEEKNSI